MNRSAREGKSAKRFERCNELDTALYKNYLYLYFNYSHTSQLLLIRPFPGLEPSIYAFTCVTEHARSGWILMAIMRLPKLFLNSMRYPMTRLKIPKMMQLGLGSTMTELDFYDCPNDLINI